MLLEWGDTRAAAAAKLSWHSYSPPWCPAPHSWGGYSVLAQCWDKRILTTRGVLYPRHREGLFC